MNKIVLLVLLAFSGQYVLAQGYGPCLRCEAGSSHNISHEPSYYIICGGYPTGWWSCQTDGYSTCITCGACPHGENCAVGTKAPKAVEELKAVFGGWSWLYDKSLPAAVGAVSRPLGLFLAAEQMMASKGKCTPGVFSGALYMDKDNPGTFYEAYSVYDMKNRVLRVLVDHGIEGNVPRELDITETTWTVKQNHQIVNQGDILQQSH